MKKGNKSRLEADEWSRSSSEKYFKIKGELKLTVLHTALRKMAGDVKQKRVLDFGCGDGVLAKQLAKKGATVLAVDKSPYAINRGKRLYGHVKGLTFETVKVHEYAEVLKTAPFDLAILSFVTITDETIDEAYEIFRLLGKVVRRGGRLLFGESHPCFHNQSFSTFKMSLQARQYRTTDCKFNVTVWEGYKPNKSLVFKDHHRPLAVVLNMFQNGQFWIERVQELYDNIDIPRLHKTTRKRHNGNVPAFLVVEGIRK